MWLCYSAVGCAVSCVKENSIDQFILQQYSNTVAWLQRQQPALTLQPGVLPIMSRCQVSYQPTIILQWSYSATGQTFLLSYYQYVSLSNMKLEQSFYTADVFFSIFSFIFLILNLVYLQLTCGSSLNLSPNRWFIVSQLCLEQ